MANGTYGIKKPALITSDDIDIFYYYRPSRSTESSDFKDLTFERLKSTLLSTVSGKTNDDNTITLPGMYDLRLPLDNFGKAGIYTIYIKPKEIFTTISDVSTLAAYPNIRGIVFSTTKSFSNDELVGYRVEYFDDENNRLDYYRIITSNNKCEPVSQNFNDSTSNGVRYRYNESSNMFFCTLSPSTAMSFKSTSTPYIGKATQKIALINTKFNPVMLEVEMTDNDLSTITTMLEGTQIRDLDNDVITTFDDEGEIYHQAAYGHITNPETGLNHDFKIPYDDVYVSSEKDRLDEIKQNI